MLGCMKNYWGCNVGITWVVVAFHHVCVIAML